MVARNTVWALMALALALNVGAEEVSMLEDISDVHDEALKLRHAVDEEGIELGAAAPDIKLLEQDQAIANKEEAAVEAIDKQQAELEASYKSIKDMDAGGKKVAAFNSVLEKEEELVEKKTSLKKTFKADMEKVRVDEVNIAKDAKVQKKMDAAIQASHDLDKEDTPKKQAKEDKEDTPKKQVKQDSEVQIAELKLDENLQAAKLSAIKKEEARLQHEAATIAAKHDSAKKAAASQDLIQYSYAVEKKEVATADKFAEDKLKVLDIKAHQKPVGAARLASIEEVNDRVSKLRHEEADEVQLLHKDKQKYLPKAKAATTPVAQAQTSGAAAAEHEPAASFQPQSAVHKDSVRPTASNKVADSTSSFWSKFRESHH